MIKSENTSTTEKTVEEKLRALYELQLTDSSIDKIRTLRGELPLEVQDLEDELEGLETRMSNYKDEMDKYETAIVNKKQSIKDANAKIKDYEEKQMKVRNNREYESLAKEAEFQKLEIELSEKRIKEFKTKIEENQKNIENTEGILNDKRADLEHKRGELDKIVAETRKEENDLLEKSEKLELEIEPRLRIAYKRIRKNVRNGLGVVAIERDACGGCFNKIPPQRQLDIKSRRKIIVCEYCGRILTDPELHFELTGIEK